MLCLAFTGSKVVVACELLDATEAGEDGRDGGCAIGWMKLLANVYSQGSSESVGVSGARR
jgi:hypothetical protein